MVLVGVIWAFIILRYISKLVTCDVRFIRDLSMFIMPMVLDRSAFLVRFMPLLVRKGACEIHFRQLIMLQAEPSNNYKNGL